MGVAFLLAQRPALRLAVYRSRSDRQCLAADHFYPRRDLGLVRLGQRRNKSIEVTDQANLGSRPRRAGRVVGRAGSAAAVDWRRCDLAGCLRLTGKRRCPDSDGSWVRRVLANVDDRQCCGNVSLCPAGAVVHFAALFRAARDGDDWLAFLDAAQPASGGRRSHRDFAGVGGADVSETPTSHPVAASPSAETPAAEMISVLGGECSGKTTLALALASQLPALHVTEVLRQFVEVNGRTPNRDEQEGIMQAQIAAERKALRRATSEGYRWVVADPGALMTAVYSIVYFDDSSLLPAALAHQSSYRLTVCCDINFPWQADGDQRDGPQHRQQANDVLMNIMEQQGQGMPTLTASGSVEQRVASVYCALDRC